VLSWGGAAVLVGCVAIARIGAQDPGDPFHDHGDKGETIHVLPTPAAAHNHNPHETQPTYAPVQGGTSVFPPSYGSGNLTDHGGPEISNASFRAIYWNALVANSTAASQGQTISSQIDGFISSFASGANWSGASTDDYTIIQQYGSSNSIAPSLVNLGSSIGTQRTSSRITDSQIQSYLASLFNSHAETASSNTIYGVYFPHGMRISLQGGSSCTSFCGYHSHFTYGGQLIKYAVFPYADCSGCSIPGLAVADMLTIVTSHEIREAVSDSLGTAWYDRSGYEADDKCVWHNLYKTTSGFWVQPEYSNGGTQTASGFTATYPGPGCVVAR
jgi:hypothetical protein